MKTGETVKHELVLFVDDIRACREKGETGEAAWLIFVALLTASIGLSAVALLTWGAVVLFVTSPLGFAIVASAIIVVASAAWLLWTLAEPDGE